jgi:hypothetical protein
MRTCPFPHPCFLTHVRSFFSLAVLLNSRDGKLIDLKVRSILLDCANRLFLQPPSFYAQPCSSQILAHVPRQWRLPSSSGSPMGFTCTSITPFQTSYWTYPQTPVKCPHRWRYFPSIWCAWEMSTRILCWRPSMLVRLLCLHFMAEFLDHQVDVPYCAPVSWLVDA